MYLTEKINTEITYFKKLHESFTIQLGNNRKTVVEADHHILFMLLSASLVMDISEEEFFETFVITDKYLTNKQELLIDAYCFIDTDDRKEKHLNVFQFKLYNEDTHAASPKEVYQFASLVNDTFLHPELSQDVKNEVLVEMKAKVDQFLLANRKNKVRYKCHYINNSKGITKANEKDFELLNRFQYDKETHGFEVQIYGIKDIEDLAIEGKISVGEEIIVIDSERANAYRYENNVTKTELGLPGQTIVGMVNVNELIRLQNKYHRNQLYSENIRLYLGDRAAVNKDIIATITSDESHWFPYMNNGISIICDSLQLGTPSNKGLPIAMKNMQIINGCQTVNALYNAKYAGETKDNFKASKVLVKIYHIEPNQERFKLAIIKATNNQNAVKTASLVANDPIQIAIQKKMEILGYLYDRKGEAKSAAKDKPIISMVTSALAYRAVFWFMAQQLRSGIGQGKVFKSEEYKKLFKVEYLESEESVTRLSVELLVASILMENIRILINTNYTKYNSQIPFFNKSLYYLVGLYYAIHKEKIDDLIRKLTMLVLENNLPKIRNDKQLRDFSEAIHSEFEDLMKVFVRFYSKLEENKFLDIDNLLRSTSFNNAFRNIEEVKKALSSQIEEDDF